MEVKEDSFGWSEDRNRRARKLIAFPITYTKQMESVSGKGKCSSKQSSRFPSCSHYVCVCMCDPYVALTGLVRAPPEHASHKENGIKERRRSFNRRECELRFIESSILSCSRKSVFPGTCTLCGT